MVNVMTVSGRYRNDGRELGAICDVRITGSPSKQNWDGSCVTFGTSGLRRERGSAEGQDKVVASGDKGRKGVGKRTELTLNGEQGSRGM